jgi:3-isopropylmalate dehydrogenase
MITPALIGQSALRTAGSVLPRNTIAACREADAVLLGPLRGDPALPLVAPHHPLQGLSALYGWLGAHSNLRPVCVPDALLSTSPLKPEAVRGMDLVIVRDVAAGLPYGSPRLLETRGSRRIAVNTAVYTDIEIRRVAEVAFHLAHHRRQGLTLAHQGKWLEIGQLWLEVVKSVASRFPDVAYQALDLDTCVLELAWNPTQFGVILAEISAGEMLAAQAAGLSGSFALHPQAILGDRTRGIFGPGHGTAPLLTGQGTANPAATILAVAMLLAIALEEFEASEAIRCATWESLAESRKPIDLCGKGETPLETLELVTRINHRVSSWNERSASRIPSTWSTKPLPETTHVDMID